MPMELFSKEYNYVRTLLINPSLGVKSPMKKHIDAIKNILGVDGPDVSYASKLSSMHWALKFRASNKMMKSAGIELKNRAGSIDNDEYFRVLVIKFLLHFHLLRKRGGQKIWIFSSPAAYTDYPSKELWATAHNKVTLKNKLGDTKERFSSRDKKNLSNATQMGLAWTHKAIMTLTNARQKGGQKSREKVKKWFADGNTSDIELNLMIGNLERGFKKIANTLDSNQLIFTDMASLRSAQTGNDADFKNSEAFVYGGRYEKLPIVYIEDAFFAKGGNVMDGMKNWARIIVHEVSHLDCSTADKLYAWAGIKPGTNITPADCSVNADSWAYFAADCANALTKNDINRAMNGI
ncbi:hypothetical protein DI392_07845 [Vibrio albus]|uniref:Lysine-specific metallo-endopeptidase domain-containing protein n=1 Tax=Vibrio albus TaxID=2200953 RepID=A0A2U3BBI3_9VIBR|nr:M35 family metallo-endopeptidase [Vibrio albus]PWI34095.1 hypothetical protein DI392_07845 [Vibrio albus]